MDTNTNPNVTVPGEVVEKLRALRPLIPEYTQLTVARAQALRAAAAADTAFVHASINTIAASQIVEHAVGRTPEAMLLEADEAARWTAVEDELRAMLKGVVAANLTRRHRLGLSALQTYSIAQALVRKPENADLLPHVAEMKRTNRFGRKVKGAELKKKQHTAAPA
jgi:hypothetical protein